MSLFSGLDDICQENVSLKDYTWLRLGGPARYFLRPKDEAQLQDVVLRCRDNGVPFYVLGMGANLLVGESGVNGAVIKLDSSRFTRIAFRKDRLTVGAGTDLRRVVVRTVRKGLAGLHCLAGIPGTVGGAIRMNAGGAWGDIGSVVHRVQVMNADGKALWRDRDELVFEYRHTSLSEPLILGVEFSLSPSDPKRVFQQVREIWTYKKNTQPFRARNAGCIFKNPRQMSAGALIDQAGLKGARCGGAVVSERHANFMIAESGTKASDMLKLISIVREKVAKKFSVHLELEVQVW
ncbi:MAG: UDP-N-acetylmuramate dehydrogenase [Phycisphaerae bacterium]|nr:UDP-N-acetylmuramate dehydrogenase [Phycisphaerae bacterium]